MTDHLLRDKIINLTNEVNNFELQLWQQELLIEDAQISPPGEGADQVTQLIFARLNAGVVDALAQRGKLLRQLEVRRPKLEALLAENKAQEETARKLTEK